MKYKNIRTGAIIEVASVCSGNEWVAVVEEKPAKTQATAKKKTTKKGVKSND